MRCICKKRKEEKTEKKKKVSHSMRLICMQEMTLVRRLILVKKKQGSIATWKCCWQRGKPKDDSFHEVRKLSKRSVNFPVCLETFHIVCKPSSGTFDLTSFCQKKVSNFSASASAMMVNRTMTVTRYLLLPKTQLTKTFPFSDNAESINWATSMKCLTMTRVIYTALLSRY